MQNERTEVNRVNRLRRERQLLRIFIGEACGNLAGLPRFFRGFHLVSVGESPTETGGSACATKLKCRRSMENREAGTQPEQLSADEVAQLFGGVA